MSQPAAMSLHEQVRNTLLFEIETGVFSSDGRLPTEPELRERFGVSRITVRRAVADLEAMGLVTRRQGMGTFVSPQRTALGTMAMGGFSDQLSAAGPTSRRAVEATVAPADEAIAEQLEVPAGSPVFHLTRVFLLDDVPLSLDDSWYSLEKYPGLDAMIDDATSTYRVLREEFGVRFHEVERRINVSFTTEATAALLDRPEHDALVRIDKVARDRDNAVVHVSTVQVVPSRMELRMTARED